MSYQVLARKYRPQTFSDLIGQDVLVRTLSNAIESNRIAHAFMLTGIRGVGKTTTARIIAKGLNCIGEDGKGNATPQPCGVCSNCVSITNDQHQDIIEMDAASRTGVDDIREIIDNAYYLPSSARYKIYIIDEVHMLSKNAFNALLKTLEEPPAHVKFIFATTEIQKIPVTILSRCQRFDLKRVQTNTLFSHFEAICQQENVTINQDALHLIVNLSEGSVRDGLSLLDQAIALSENTVTEEHVRSMLGLANNAIVGNLFENLATGNISEVLDIFNTQYQQGADPTLLIQELLSFCYTLTQAIIAKDTLKSSSLSEEEIARIQTLSEKLDITFTTRCWQMLLKGLEELKYAPNSLMASNMILIRIAYMSNLPSPAKIITTLQSQPNKETEISNSTTQTSLQATSIPANTDKSEQNTTSITTTQALSENLAPISFKAAKNNIDKKSASNESNYPTNTAAATSLQLASEPIAMASHEEDESLEQHYDTMPQDFASTVALFQQHNEILLYNWLKNDVNLVSFQPGHIEINPSPNLPSNFAYSISSHLSEWTGKKWVISVNNQAEHAATLSEQEKLSKQQAIEEMYQEPIIKDLLEVFPDSKITSITPAEQTTNPTNTDAS